MAIVLPVAVFLLLWRSSLALGDSSRTAFLRAVVAVGVITVAITELLSIPYLLTTVGFTLAWAATLIGTIVFYRRCLKARGSYKDPAARPPLHLPTHTTFVDRSLAAANFLILAGIGFIAIVSPPNTSDSMEYHLPRMVLWVSNHTLRVFPTADFAQLVQGTAAEFATLNAYLLWGSDRLSNLVEFFCLAGSAVAASLIASKLGAQRTGQLLAALFVVTVPEAVLESSGSMTTVVVSFWIVTACYFMLQAGTMSNRRDTLTSAFATGLAFLTKGIAFIYLPILLLGCILFRPRAAMLWLLQRAPVFLACALLLNVGQFYRAYQVTGNPLGSPFPAGGPRLHFSNDRITPGEIVASVLRHATLHLGTPSDRLNTRVETATRGAIHAVGEDPDDPREVWLGYPFSIGHPSRLETQAGNPVHLLLAIFCLCAVGCLRPRTKEDRILWYTASIFAAFIVFCALVRWQPWGSRFHLPLFFLMAATAGLVFERTLRRSWIVITFAAFLCVAALPYLVSNSIRSLVATKKNFPTVFEPRAELYFGDQHASLAPGYLAMAARIRASHCGNVAIDAFIPVPDDQIVNSPPGFYVYPLFAQLGIDGTTHRVGYFDVQNSTNRFKPLKQPWNACAIVCLSCLQSNGKRSDSRLGPTELFGDSELVFPTIPRPVQ